MHRGLAVVITIVAGSTWSLVEACRVPLETPTTTASSVSALAHGTQGGGANVLRRVPTGL